MPRRKTKDGEFWSRKDSFREVDLSADGTTEDIQPGGGEGWTELWNGDPDSADDTKWRDFLGGDSGAKRREEAWLLS